MLLDPLPEGPKKEKIPKVVRRGCKRSFRPRAPKASWIATQGDLKLVPFLPDTDEAAFEEPARRHARKDSNRILGFSDFLLFAKEPSPRHFLKPCKTLFRSMFSDDHVWVYVQLWTMVVLLCPN